MSTSTMTTTIIVVVFLSFSAAAAAAGPAETMVAFQQAYVTNQCDKLYEMLAGQWYANADGPGTGTILNRTNIKQICAMFSPPAADNAFIPIAPFSYQTSLDAYGSISFASLQGFMGASNDSVCNVVWGDNYFAKTKGNQILEMVETYDPFGYKTKYDACHPNPQQVNPRSPPSLPPRAREASSSSSLLLEGLMEAYALRQCSSLAEFVVDDGSFVWHDHDMKRSLSDLVAMCNDRTNAIGYMFTGSFQDSSFEHLFGVFGFSVLTPVPSVCSFMLEFKAMGDVDASRTKLSAATIVYDLDAFNTNVTACQNKKE